MGNTLYWLTAGIRGQRWQLDNENAKYITSPECNLAFVRNKVIYYIDLPPGFMLSPFLSRITLEMGDQSGVIHKINPFVSWK